MKEYLFVNILLINSKSTKPMHLQHVLEMPLNSCLTSQGSAALLYCPEPNLNTSLIVTTWSIELSTRAVLREILTKSIDLRPCKHIA